MGRFVPKVLREVGVEVDARVARDRELGGVNAVLSDISRITSSSSKRMHYEALLRGPALTHAEYDRVARQAGRELASQPTDLEAVLTLISASPTSGVNALERAVGKLAAAQQTMHDALGAALKTSKTSNDSAATYKRYAEVDDPAVIMLALQGVSGLSSDTDRRILLESIAPKALGKKDQKLRNAFFEACESFSSDTDLRIVLQEALPHAHADPAITLAVFKLVETKMSSDSDRRVVLTFAASAHLVNTTAARSAYVAAAKAMSSGSDYTVAMQALLKQ
jgi:hypothetical protein